MSQGKVREFDEHTFTKMFGSGFAPSIEYFREINSAYLALQEKCAALEAEVKIQDEANDILTRNLNEAKMSYEKLKKTYCEVFDDRDLKDQQIKSLREQNEMLRGALQITQGHSNCYCDECKEISKKYWSPSKAKSTDEKWSGDL